jgi:hypothetical protein
MHPIFVIVSDVQQLLWRKTVGTMPSACSYLLVALIHEPYIFRVLMYCDA